MLSVCVCVISRVSTPKVCAFENGKKKVDNTNHKQESIGWSADVDLKRGSRGKIGQL